MRIINPNLSITHPSIGTSPMSLATQPWTSVILGTAQVDNHHEVASAQTSSAREPILRCINFQSSLPKFGYCGCTVKLEWYRIRTQPSAFIKGLSLMPQHFHRQLIWCS